MALCEFQYEIVVLLIAFASIQVTNAGNEDIPSDFELPPDVTVVDGNFFTHTAMRALIGADQPTTFKVLKVSMAEFPALTGQSVSYAVLQYPGGSVNPPHAHPCSAELLFLLTGSLEVGFIDTTNKLYTQTLHAGDMFVFPKGLVQYQYNNDAQEYAFALSSFGSANPGTESVPGAVFTSGISDEILAKAFKTDVSTVQKIKISLAPKARF